MVRGGKLLDDMLKMIGLDRSRLYITNSVKCRPPENRDPMNTEKDACKGYLQRQRALMQPKIIVCLGRVSAMEIIRPDFKISQEHGQFFEKDGCLMMALYHPAALLREYGKNRNFRGSETPAGQDRGGLPARAGFLRHEGKGRAPCRYALFILSSCFVQVRARGYAPAPVPSAGC